MNYLRRHISVVPRATEHRPVDHIPVEQALEEIRAGRYRAYVERVRAIADKEKRREAKKYGPAYTFCGRFSYVNQSGVQEASGIVCVDYDGLEDVEQARARVQASPHTLAAFRSVSGEHSQGLKVLVPVEPPPTTNEENHIAYETVAALWGLVADEATKDISRLCYTSVDPDVYVNPEAAPVPVDYTAARTSKRRERSGSEISVLPDGEKYVILRGAGGLLRDWGFAPDVIETALQAIRERHGESPGEPEPIHELAEWLGTKAPSHDLRAFMAEVARNAPGAADVTAFLPVQVNGHGSHVQAYVATEETETGNAETTEIKSVPWVPFPVECLPGPAADLVRAQAAAQGCDPALVAIAVLAVMAAAVGNSHRVEIKGGWYAPSTLWLLGVDPSGGGKTPAMRAAMRPVLSLEMEESERYKTRWDVYQEQLAAWKDTKPRREADRPDKPFPRQRFRIGDATVESVVALHADNPRGLLLYRDEAAAWLGSFDRYASGDSDMQTWIELYEGDRITVDRKGGGGTVIDVERPAVCVLGGIQPDILQRSLQPHHFASGFEPRLLYVMPPHSTSRWTEAEVTQEVSNNYYDMIIYLYRTFTYTASDRPLLLRLGREAKARYVDFFNRASDLIARMPDGPLRSAYVKNRELAVRLAMILHLASQAPKNDEVGEVAMIAGIRLAEWFRYEKHRVHQTLGFMNASMSDEERLINGLPPRFSAKDIADVRGVSERMGRNIATELETLGLCRRVPCSGKAKLYEPTPKGLEKNLPPPVIS